MAAVSPSDLPRILGFNVSTCAIAIVAVLARLVCRRVKRSSVWWDDYCILVAWALSGAVLLMYTIWLIPHGFGKPIVASPPNADVIMRQGMFIHEIQLPLALAFAKASAFFFYWRVLRCVKARAITVAMLLVVALWELGILVATMLQCRPVSAFWFDNSPSPTAARGCAGFNVTHYLHAVGIPDVATDAALVLLPLPFVWAHCIARRQKAALGGAVALGLLITLIAIARYFYSLRQDYNSPNITWDTVDIQLWSVVEVNLTIATVCLLTLYPFVPAPRQMVLHQQPERKIGSSGAAWWKAPGPAPIPDEPVPKLKDHPFMRTRQHENGDLGIRLNDPLVISR